MSKHLLLKNLLDVRCGPAFGLLNLSGLFVTNNRAVATVDLCQVRVQNRLPSECSLSCTSLADRSGHSGVCDIEKPVYDLDLVVVVDSFASLVMLLDYPIDKRSHLTSSHVIVHVVRDGLTAEHHKLGNVSNIVHGSPFKTHRGPVVYRPPADLCQSCQLKNSGFSSEPCGGIHAFHGLPALDTPDLNTQPGPGDSGAPAGGA